MKRNLLPPVLSYVLLGLRAQSQNASTFSKDVASIIGNNCTVRHRPRQIDPMSFTYYSEVKSRAGTIACTTERKIMPPWHPNPNYSRFFNERILTQKQLAALRTWADAGAPSGRTVARPYSDVYSPAGAGTVDVNLTDVSSGNYLLKVKTAGETLSQKVVKH